MDIHTSPPTSLVTGGTGGIGRAVARRLAAAGDRVLVVGRDAERGASILAELEIAAPDRAHQFLAADLSLLGETRRLAATVAGLTERLDAVVPCAGVFALAPTFTTEGLEHTMALNYLSRFALVSDLVPLLRPHGRIVLVAAAGQYRDRLDLTALAPGRSHSARRLSGASQFANDLYAVELAERLAPQGVAATCVHPGVTRSDVFRSARGVPRPVRGIAVAVQSLLGRSPDVAAETPAYLARSPEAAGITGRFFRRARRELPVPTRALDVGRRTALWQVSVDVIEEVTGTPVPAHAAEAAP